MAVRNFSSMESEASIVASLTSILNGPCPLVQVTYRLILFHRDIFRLLKGRCKRRSEDLFETLRNIL